MRKHGYVAKQNRLVKDMSPLPGRPLSLAPVAITNFVAVLALGPGYGARRASGKEELGSKRLIPP